MKPRSTSEILAAARELIENRRFMCVCPAITNVVRWNEVVAGAALVKEIKRSLGSFNYVSSWAIAHGVSEDTKWSEYRLAWIDQMIGLYQEQGD